jgi:hypothetical protein
VEGLVRKHDKGNPLRTHAEKAAIGIYHKAVTWNRSGKLAGCHGGLTGSHVLLVLQSLIFDFLNDNTGRLTSEVCWAHRRRLEPVQVFLVVAECSQRHAWRQTGVCAGHDPGAGTRCAEANERLCLRLHELATNRVAGAGADCIHVRNGKAGR